MRERGHLRPRLARCCYRAGGVAFAALLVPASGAAPALAQKGGTATVGTQTEGWYNTATGDACESELDCSLLPAVDAYQSDTLHVGVSAGKPTAATVIELAMFEAGIPDGMDIVGGTLSLPVDTAPRHGSLQPETAKLVACHVTDFFMGEQGQLKKPPKTDCDGASATAEYSADPAVFTVDLTAFAPKWTAGESAALAVMPAPDAEPSETWHVAFWGKDYGSSEEDVPVEAGSEDPQPITADLKYEPKKDDSPVVPPPPVEPPVDLGVPELGEVIEPLPAEPVDAAAPEVAEIGDTTPQGAPQAVAAETAPSFLTLGYPYPIAWLMPLLLLIGFTVTGRSLTKKLDPMPGMRLSW